MARNTRPRWARKLSRTAWKHLKEGQSTEHPTLRDLKVDAGTCPECKSILARLAA